MEATVIATISLARGDFGFLILDFGLSQFS